MSIESNKALVREITEELWNKWNLNVIDECFSPNFINHDAINPQVRNRQEFKDWVKAVSVAYPQGKYAIEFLIAEGDMVFSFNPHHAKNSGDYFGFPATGKEVIYSASSASRIVDGKIVETWFIYDLFSQLVQLGLVKNPWATE